MPNNTGAAPARQEIPLAERAKLSAMLALAEEAANPAEAERLAALVAAERLLGRLGLTLGDLATLPAPEKRVPELGIWRATCRALLERPGTLRPWERSFLADLPGFPRLSTKQRYVLTEIADRVLGGDLAR